MANWICPGRKAAWFGSLVRTSPLGLLFLSQPLLCSLGTAGWFLIAAVSAFRTEVPQIFGSFPHRNCVFRHRRQRAPDWFCVHWEHYLCKSKSQALGKEALAVTFYCLQLKIHWFKISYSQKYGFLFSCLEDLTSCHFGVPLHTQSVWHSLSGFAQQGWQCASDCVFPLFL